VGFLERRRRKKEAQRKLEWHADSYIRMYEDCWKNMKGAERKKLFEDFFDGLTKYTSFGKFNLESVRNPKKEAKKEFSELSETRRVDIMEILAVTRDDVGTEMERSLRRMDKSNNSGMEEYNRRKEKQENFYWKYFRRNSSYIHPEWHGDKPSEDRTSDEELDEIVDEYLLGMHDSDENYEETTTFRHLSYLFITEFAKRREAQSRFTKDSQTEDKKARRGKREITEEDLKGTHYDLLKVSMDASLKEIKEAWKELILKWHPDVNPDNPKLAERMAIALNKARDILSDRTKRKKYDEELDQRFV